MITLADILPGIMPRLLGRRPTTPRGLDKEARECRAWLIERQRVMRSLELRGMGRYAPEVLSRKPGGLNGHDS